MGLFPEREKPGVTEIPSSPEIPPDIEKAGVKPVQENFSQRSSGGPINFSPTPQAPAVTATVPADDIALQKWANGSAVLSLTWFAKYWIRAIKKALRAGVQIIVSQRS